MSDPQLPAAGAYRSLRIALPAVARLVIVVSGEVFDVNPGKRRSQRASRFRANVRFSFGPFLATIETSCDRLAELIETAGLPR